MSTSSTITPRLTAGRLVLAVGLACTVLGMVAYIVQVAAMHHLATPWYLPLAATLGVFLVVIALWQRRSIWRIVALLLVLLIAGAAWTYVLATRVPPYSGPVAEGQSFPAFTTIRADGTTFTQRDLEGNQDNVLVVFRGRW